MTRSGMLGVNNALAHNWGKRKTEGRSAKQAAVVKPTSPGV